MQKYFCNIYQTLSLLDQIFIHKGEKPPKNKFFAEAYASLEYYITMFSTAFVTI